MRILPFQVLFRLHLVALLVLTLWFRPFNGAARTISLQDIGATYVALPEVSIYLAKEIITLDENRPQAQAVAVQGDRILAVGDLETMKQAAGDQRVKGRVLPVKRGDRPF